MLLHSAEAPWRVSFACHVPASGDATSTNQKYGGPPCRSADLVATFPSGAISESSPSRDSSAAKTTRKGAPFHGAIGEERTASRAASSQLPAGPLACAPTTETKSAPAISSNAVTAAANWRAGNNRAPGPPSTAAKRYSESLWLNHGKIYRQATLTRRAAACDHKFSPSREGDFGAFHLGRRFRFGSWLRENAAAKQVGRMPLVRSLDTGADVLHSRRRNQTRGIAFYKTLPRSRFRAAMVRSRIGRSA